jgi:hypothetical protein|eukprot:566792-Prymnesium_polylepis.1
MVTRDDAKTLLGKLAEKTATEADLRRFQDAFANTKKEADKGELVKQYKKMLRSRRGVAEAVANVKPLVAKAAKAPIATPAVSPVPEVAPTGAADDDDEYELESLF